MTLWLDAQISPLLAPWIAEEFGIDCRAVADFGLHRAKDRQIFEAAGQTGAVVMSKDRDFIDLLTLNGPPPKVIWLTCGNCSNASLKLLLAATLGAAIDLLEKGDTIVQIA
jgi:predicted nuclease of predicted toxin-antitoxin system